MTHERLLIPTATTLGLIIFWLIYSDAAPTASPPSIVADAHVAHAIPIR